MHEQHLRQMLRLLQPVLKDTVKAEQILTRYWRSRMALVWEVGDVHKAANELELALTNNEAINVLQTLLHQHNPQSGIKWEDLTAHIEVHVLGRKLNRREILEFVKHDKLTIQQ